MNDKHTSSQHTNLGQVIIASHVMTTGLNARRTRRIALLLTASVALMMTGSGIIMPIFARRLGELGSGVKALGLLSMSFALAQLISSPLMGIFADRFGRRPLILAALAAFTLANIGFMFAPSTAVLILVRAMGAAFTAGLFPAAMGIISDIIPKERRGRWIGIVMGSYGAGLIFGPVLGGILYDTLGFAAPFIVSASLAAIALIAAMILVPETRTPQVRRREALLRRREMDMSSDKTVRKSSLWAALPKPLTVFAMLLLLDLSATFVFAFTEPQMLFFFYQDLGWTTIRFGLIAGAYGLAMTCGQIAFGQLSDKVGRKPVIVAGLLLAITFYAGLAFLRSFPLILLTAVVAGFGEALTSPARSAFYFDITPPQFRSRVVGIKGSAGSLGGVLGPLLVAVVSAVLEPQGVFITAGIVLLSMAVLTLLLLKEPHHLVTEKGDMMRQVSDRRALAAQAALRGVILEATAAREIRQLRIKSDPAHSGQ